MTKKKPTLREEINRLHQEIESSANNQELLEEALSVLETQLQDQGWIKLFGGGKELSKSALNTLYDLGRAYWLKNPLIRRAVEIQALYVFAQGMTIQADHEPVDVVIQRFLKDRKNYNSISSHQAWMQNERDLALSGNLFFALFTTPETGRVIVRTIPFYEIAEIVCNPDDFKEPWFYRREFMITTFDDTTGNTSERTEIQYYPDWKYDPDEKPDQIGSYKVNWDSPVYHVKTNCLPDMKYGVSELYSAIDWSQAYKRFLENWGKLTEAYARFAWGITTKGGQAKVSAAKARMETLFAKTDPNTDEDLEGTVRTKQLPVGGVFTSTEGVTLNAIRTQGATTSMEDARRLMLMVASASGIPEQILTGDPSTGNLATAKAMERPLELQFRNRQTFWVDTWWDLCQYVIDQAIEAGELPGIKEEDPYTGEITYCLLSTDDAEDETKEFITRDVTITFPPLLEHDVLQTVQAIISAATIDNKTLAGTMDRKTMAGLLLRALKVENAEGILDTLPEEPQYDRVTAPPTPDTGGYGGFGGIDYTEESLNNLLKDTIKDVQNAARKLQEAEDPEGQWVTINGVHILIKDGESTADAFKRTTGKDLDQGGKPADGGEKSGEGKIHKTQPNRMKGAELDKFYDDFERKHERIHLIGAEYADKDSLTHISENFDKITEKYPEANITGVSFDSIPEKEGKILAATNPYNELIFNTNVFSGNKEDAISTIKNSQDRGWMVKTSDPIGGILAHEYGHALYQEMYKDERMHPRLNELSKIQFTKDELSEYAFTNHEEAFAEGFAAINYGLSRESLKSEYVKKQKAIIEEFKKGTYRIKRGV